MSLTSTQLNSQDFPTGSSPSNSKPVSKGKPVTSVTSTSKFVLLPLASNKIGPFNAALSVVPGASEQKSKLIGEMLIKVSATISTSTCCTPSKFSTKTSFILTSSMNASDSSIHPSTSISNAITLAFGNAVFHPAKALWPSSKTESPQGPGGPELSQAKAPLSTIPLSPKVLTLTVG